MRSPRQVQIFARGWSSGRPAASTILIGATAGLFIAQYCVRFLAGEPGAAELENLLALSRDSLLRHWYGWQLITYMFLHQGPLHLFVNMASLYFAAREVESLIGSRHLLAIYFGGGLAGGIAHLLWGPAVPLMGASAGVCAVVIAFTTILPEMELTAWIFFVLPLRLKAKFFAAGLTLVSLFLVFFSPTLGTTSHLAHLAGCLLGWVYIKQLGYGNPLFIQKYIFKRRQRAERFARMSPAQFISQEIDPVLDKISREGIHSLTRAEKKILERGREKIAKKVTS